MIGQPRTSPIGVSILAHAVQAVQFDRRGPGWVLRDAVSVPRDQVATPFGEHDARRLVEVLRRRRFVGKQVVAAVPNPDLIRGLVEVRPDNEDPLLSAAFEVERTNGLEPESYELAAWLPEFPAESRQRAVMVNGCPHQAAERFVAAFAGAGLDLVALDSRAGAVSRSVDTGSGFAGDHITAILDVDREDTELVLVRRGVVVYQRALITVGLRLAVEHLTRQGLDVPLATHTLHHPNRKPGEAFDGSARQAALEAFAQALCREVDPALDYAARLYAPQVIERLAVVGEGAAVSGLEDTLTQRLSLAPASTQRPDVVGVQNDRQLAVASGLALAPDTAGLNLLPERAIARRDQRRKTHGGLLVTAAYAALLLLGSACYLAFSAPDRALAANDQLAVETNRVSQLSASSDALRRQLNEAQRQVEATRVLSERPNWSTLLGLIAQAGGGEVVLEAVRVRTTGPTIDAGAEVQIEGVTLDPWQVSTFVLNLEKLGLFDRVEIADSQRAPRGANTLTGFTINAQINAGVAEESP